MMIINNSSNISMAKPLPNLVIVILMGLVLLCLLGRSLVLVIIQKMSKLGSSSGRRPLHVQLNCAAARMPESKLI